MKWNMPNYLRAPLYVLAFCMVLTWAGLGIMGIFHFWLAVLGPDSWSGDGPFAATTGTIVFIVASFCTWVIMEDG